LLPCGLVEETKNLSGNVLPPGLLVVHDTGGGGEDDVTELTRRQELDNPLLEIAELDIVTGGDDTRLVDLQEELGLGGEDQLGGNVRGR
jgi:hypothetical protein